MAKAKTKTDESEENINFKNPKESIPRLAREAIDAGATIKEVASVLKIEEEDAEAEGKKSGELGSRYVGV